MMRALILLILLTGCATAERLPTVTPCKPGDLMRFTANGYVIDCTKTPHATVPAPKDKPFPYGPKVAL
jgi:hypothetical protein